MLRDLHGAGEDLPDKPSSLGNSPSPFGANAAGNRIRKPENLCDTHTRGMTLEKSLRSKIRAAAKFFYEGPKKFWMRGVTYGTFEPREGSDYPSPERVAQDFALMREAGINTVRIYTVPPAYLLDEA